MFKRMVDIDLKNAEVLRHALLDAAVNGEAFEGRQSNHGLKYEIRFAMTGRRGGHTIFSVWMVRRGESVPRLVTAYIE